MRFRETPPDMSILDRQRIAHERRLASAGARAVDKKTREAQSGQRARMAAAQLGGLVNAVKVQTGRSVDDRGNPNAFGVIYADNGDESRAGQALQAYSRGTTIQPIRGNWLWYQTDVIRRTAKVPGDTRRGRLTPERYRKLGSPLGPLQFAQINPRFARLYVEVADISVKTGLASRPGKRRSRTKVRTQRVTVFLGIKNTRRAQRYDPQAIVRASFNQVPAEIAREMAADLRR